MEKIIKNIEGYEIIEYKNTNIYIINNVLDDEYCKETINIIDKACVINTKDNNKNIDTIIDDNIECFVNTISDIKCENIESYYTFPTKQVMYEKTLSEIKVRGNVANTLHKEITNSEIENCENKIIDVVTNIIDIMNKINKNISCKYINKVILRKIYGEIKDHIDGLYFSESYNIKYINGNTNVENDKTRINLRNISLIFSLNDDYEGGVFEFPNYGISHKLKKGSVIIFPPYWTHNYRAKKLENNTYHYTITTWGYNKEESYIPIIRPIQKK